MEINNINEVQNIFCLDLENEGYFDCEYYSYVDTTTIQKNGEQNDNCLQKHKDDSS